MFVRVTTTPRGIVLSPLPETAQTMTQVATSLVRSSIARPEIGEIVQTLLQPSGAADAVKTAASAEADDGDAHVVIGAGDLGPGLG